MPRWKLTLEYDGRRFVGWQRQENGPSVQQAVEEAFTRFSGETVRLACAGRTDAGVHALGQVAHADLNRVFPSETIRNALNHHLAAWPVSVLAVEAVSDDFHARFSCCGRRYRYRILNRRPPPALDAGRVWHVRRPLAVEAMAAAARVLVGHHDFTTFRATLCQAKSPLRTLDQLDVLAVGEEIHILAAARSFLHHQVRNMVGTLAAVGSGQWEVARVAQALAARDRRAGGPTAPAEGLYFIAALYPANPSYPASNPA